MISLNAAGLSRGFLGTVLSTRTVNQIVAGIALIVNLLITELFSVYMGVRKILIIPTEGSHLGCGLSCISGASSVLTELENGYKKLRRTYASI